MGTKSGSAGKQARGKAKKKGRGAPSLEERTAFDMPAERFRGSGKGAEPALTRWAGAILGGRGGEVAVRVPDSPQDTNYTCGPAALRGALAAFGIGVDEDELAADAETSASGGTSVKGLAYAAKARGLAADEVTGMSLEDLMTHLDGGQVVLACIQAGPDAASYDSSHWVVPCAVQWSTSNAITVEMMDPSVDGARSVCSAAEFLERWHCMDMGEEIGGLALVVTGDEPANMTAIDGPTTPL